MRPIIYPYKLGSHSAKLLAEGLGTKQVRPDGFYKHKKGDLVINWGNSHYPIWDMDTESTLNHPDEVQFTINKLETFIRLKESNVPTPKWTTDSGQANQWIDDGMVVFCRANLRGRSGNGIIIIDNEPVPDDIPLYTLNIGKRYEYRVHVFGEQVIDFQKKRRSTNGTINDDIRSHANGWIFCREGVELPDKVKQTAIKAVYAMGLDFGAVDVAYRARTDEAFVFEVNTAPGLEGQTLLSYIKAFKEIV